MFSTITILSIFAEIFLAGILISGAYTFFRRFFFSRQRTDGLLGGALIFSSFHLIGIIASRLLFNIDVDVTVLQEIANISLAMASLFLLLLSLEKSGLKNRSLPWFCVVIAAVLITFTLIPSFNIERVYDPSGLAITSPTVFLVRFFWLISWLLVALVSFLKMRGLAEPKERRLEAIMITGAIMISFGYSVSIGYFVYNNDLYLLAAWLFLLFSYSIFIVGAVILPRDDISENPVNFLRTRILFKLIVLFVFMIILVVEATTLATIAISRSSLEKAAVEANRQIAFGVADKVRYIFEKEKSLPMLYSRLQQESEKIYSSENRHVYMVDGKGKVLVHPIPVAAPSGTDLSSIPAVKEVIRGRAGWMKFADAKGNPMLGAYVPVRELGIGIIAAEPVANAFFEIKRVETNSLIFVIIGILAAVIVGIIFAKDIEGPINSLIFGTEQIRKGNLDYRINTRSIDEIGHLAKEFNLMTGSLKESQEHLIASEKLAALGTMAAGMAHEIKNPLVALRTFTQLIPIKWEDAEFRKKFSDIVPLEIERINKIAENLLKFGRPSKPEIREVNINSVLEEVLELLENQFRKNNIRIATKFAQVGPIKGDPAQLSQAFLNIILNAVQAMPQGGELIIKSDTGHVIQLGKITQQGFVSESDENTAEKRQPTVFVEITDTGEGIQEDKMRNLFDPFFTTKSNGTGMGLPITLRIIEDHKGSIKVRSQLGKGTTFIIMLPAEVRPAEEKEA